MTNVFSYILFAVALIAAGWLLIVWRGFAQDWLPAELASAKVVQIERTLFMSEPFAVVGRPDQVFRLADGLHVPVENKNRNGHGVYASDIAQLSLQAWLMRKNGLETASFGFVAINDRLTGKRVAKRVELKDDRYCEQLLVRYLDIVEQRVAPQKSRGAKCNSCGHRAACVGSN
jgi:CRISPR-associated exonuclease Cas4